jgi:membrane-bound metal-dependent hydrolase YbcI (DUF457 family)
MDPFSHYMIAFLIGRQLKLKRNQMMALTFSALVLDIDVIYYLYPHHFLPVHGSITHTFLAMIFFWIICTALFFVWKRRFLGGCVFLGIGSHIVLDMVNTLSPFDGGKQLLWPLERTYYSLGDIVPNPHLAWAILAAAILSFSIVMAWKRYKEGDAFWRVWFDERVWLYRRRRVRDSANKNNGVMEDKVQ